MIVREIGRWLRRCIGMLILLVLLVQLPVPVGGAKLSSQQSFSSSSVRDQITRQAVSAVAHSSFGPSLEMKENADFLLTPALLVQQAVSPDTVITYPSE